MHGPSDNLKRNLQEFDLCTARDLKRCEREVRRLCSDLPDFDSVWLDALVQMGCVTPWQAQILQSDDPSQLQLDRFVLIEPLGGKTWLASTGVHSRPVVLRQLDPDRGPYDVDAIRQLVTDVNSSRHDDPPPESLCVPREVVTKATDVFLASPFVEGYASDELVLRGGRLPHAAVQGVGLNLLQALAWLESTNHWHGRISLRNIRIRPDGQAVLVAPLTAWLERPTLSFGDELQLQDVECIAPELVSTGRSPSTASEIYSAGIVLWQLLAARSPFLTTDPINRILKAQQEDVADVQSMVPECPLWLSTALQKMTRRNASLRPTSVRSVLDDWAQHASAYRVETRRLIQQLPDRALRRRKPPVGRLGQAVRGSAIAALLLVFAAIGIQRDLIPLPLRISGPAGNLPPAAGSDLPPEPQTVERPLVETGPLGHRVLPPPDAAGVVLLESGQTYEASTLAFPGSMHIEPSAASPVTVIVPSGQSWQLKARQVSLSDILVQHQTLPPAPRTAVPLIQTTSDVLSVRRCSLLSHQMSAAIAWSSATDHTGVVRLSDVAAAGSGYALNLLSAARRCELDNVLLLSRSGGLRVDTDGQQTLPPVYLNQVTQAAGRSLIDVFTSSTATSPQQLSIEAGESVLVPTTALVRWAGVEEWTSQEAVVRFVLPERGNPTIVPPGLDPAVVLDRSLQQLVALPEQQVILESLLLAEPEFRRQPESTDGLPGRFDGYQLIDYAGPKLSADLPGCDTQRLLEPTSLKRNHADRTVSSTGR